MPLPSLDTLKLNARLVAEAADRFGADLLSATFDAYEPARIILSQRTMQALCRGREVKLHGTLGVEVMVDGVVYLGSVDRRLIPPTAIADDVVRLLDPADGPPPTRAA